MKSKLMGVLVVGLLTGPMGAQANLITNGGFESGLTGWTCDTIVGNCSVDDFGVPREGAFHGWGFDNGGTGTLSQTFDTVPDAPYLLEFWFGSSTESPTNSLSVAVGNLAQSFFFPVGDVASWTFYSSPFLATSASSTLEFSFSTELFSGTLWFDDVRVTNTAMTVPEPSTLALLGLGLVGMGFARRRKAT